MFTATKRMFTALTRPRCAGIAALLLGLTTAPGFAQDMGDAAMNVVVTDVLKLVVNTNSLTLILGPVHGYLYNYGIFAEGQLTVTSNRSWGLTVHSSGPNLVNGIETVPVENLNISYMQGIALSTLPQSLAFSQPPVQGENLTLVYSVAMANQAFLKPGGTYSTTLTYMVAYE